jgi:hypothetical protein
MRRVFEEAVFVVVAAVPFCTIDNYLSAESIN